MQFPGIPAKLLRLGLAISLVMSATVASKAFAADEVNVYSSRQPFLIKPIFDQFTKETGIKVNTVFESVILKDLNSWFVGDEKVIT